MTIKNPTPEGIRAYLEGVVSGEIRLQDVEKDKNREKVFNLLHRLPNNLPIPLVEKALAKFVKSGHATWELLPDLQKDHLDAFLRVVATLATSGEEEAFDAFYLEAAKQGNVLLAHNLLGLTDKAQDISELAQLFRETEPLSAPMVASARGVLEKLSNQDTLEEDELNDHMLMVLILARDASPASIRSLENYVTESVELFPDSPAKDLVHLALQSFPSNAGDKLLESLQVEELSE